MLPYGDLLCCRFSRRGFLRLASILGLRSAWQSLVGGGREGIAGALASLERADPTSTSTVELTSTPAPHKNFFPEENLSTVIVAHNPEVRGYPALAPFDPSATYPEYLYGQEVLSEGNGVYGLVREALRLMAPEGFGTPGWNPLGELIKAGDMVVIKPNWVEDPSWERGKITHPAVLRPIIDYVHKACGPTGRITLAEGPWAAGVFERVVEITGIRQMVEHLAIQHGVPLVLEDLNKAAREATPLIDLGELSELRRVDRKWYDAHHNEMHPSDDPGVGRYRISPTVLEADVVISVPKVKVHCMAGVTLAMKNMLGIIPSWDGPYEEVALKDCAHTSDLDLQAGERGEYLDNDTIWRSIADLNRILLYADRDGYLYPHRQRRYLAIIDGVIAGEENQFNPHPHPLSTIIIGHEPLTVDAVTARVMGFDPNRIKSVREASESRGGSETLPFPLGTSDAARIRVLTNVEGGLSAIYRQPLLPEMHVYPWGGHIEADDFDPPQIAEHNWDPRSGELRVRVGDPAGVACVRVAYSSGDERRMEELALKNGDRIDGWWGIEFLPGTDVEEVTIIAHDRLFNVKQKTVRLGDVIP